MNQPTERVKVSLPHAPDVVLDVENSGNQDEIRAVYTAATGFIRSDHELAVSLGRHQQDVSMSLPADNLNPARPKQRVKISLVHGCDVVVEVNNPGDQDEIRAAYRQATGFIGSDHELAVSLA